jgi:hypothetical protein
MRDGHLGRRLLLAFHRAKTSWPFLIVASALAAATALSPLFDVWDKTQVALGWKPDQLQLARSNEKGVFSRHLVEVAWRRVFWMRRYGLAVEDGLPISTRDIDWDNYLKVLETWNAELMVNIIQLQVFYGTEKSRTFQYDIQRQFGVLHGCLNRLHFREAYAARNDAPCRIPGHVGGDDIQNAVALRHGLDTLNVRLFCFATGLTPQGDACRGG